jgi:predicted RNase H-like HicB family nuclease
VFANSFLYQRYIKYMESDRMKIEIDREEDGRWIAEIPDLPGVMVYGASRDEAISKAEALALRVLADRLDHGEKIPELKEVFTIAA